MASPPVDRLGVVQDELTGETFIPASRRPDGTWRKPRRVKEGYIPQEEMPVYENKGVQWLKSKPLLPPGLNPTQIAIATTVKTDSTSSTMSKAAKKNAKRRDKKKQHQSNVVDGMVKNLSCPLSDVHINESQSPDKGLPKQAKQIDKSNDNKQELLKKLRTLRKKLKQIEELESRISSGELKEPQKEQLEKIAKKQALVDEIEDLQLDMEDI